MDVDDSVLAADRAAAVRRSLMGLLQHPVDDSALAADRAAVRLLAL